MQRDKGLKAPLDLSSEDFQFPHDLNHSHTTKAFLKCKYSCPTCKQCNCGAPRYFYTPECQECFECREEAFDTTYFKFHSLPPTVKFFCRRLKQLAKKDRDEHGYTIYQRGDSFYIQQDQGSPALTVSDFSSLTGDKLLFVLKPDRVYLLHSHPFSSHPAPSLLDLQTAERFRNFYVDVTCVVVGRKGYWFY